MSCPYRFTCIATIGAVAAHPCPYCGAIVPTGKDPQDYCIMVEEPEPKPEYIDSQEAITIEQDTVLEAMLNSRKKK